jgi:hypothetical protein
MLLTMVPEGDLGGCRDGAGGYGGTKRPSCGQYHQSGNCNTSYTNFTEPPTDRRGEGVGMCFH